MRRWRCTVCKYVHVGDEPPDICPVCKVGKEKFVEIDENGEPLAPLPSTGPDHREPRVEEKAPAGAIGALVERYHLHPITVHVPNGVIPISVAFVLAAAALNFAGLAQAAFYNTLCVVASLPAVLFTGYSSWLTKYQGAWTSRFATKIVSSTVCAAAAVALAIWYWADPDVCAPGSPGRWPFLLVNGIMLAAASAAGYVGGKLVFKD